MLPRAASIIFGTVLRAAGDTKTPMKIGVWVNVINIVLNFFWTTSKEVYCSENNKKKITYNPKAIAIFKKGITENPCKYLFNLIETEPSPMAEIKEWEPHRVIPEAWPDWNDFELFINSIPESDKCNEYRRFFAAFKENGYRAVPFRFKYCIKHDE